LRLPVITARPFRDGRPEVLRALPGHNVWCPMRRSRHLQYGLTCLYSLGVTLADTLDDLISSRRIEPQLAMKIMATFDQAIAQVLGEKVKARMSFKVARPG